MRVLQIVTDTDPRGAQRFALDLHDGLARLGHRVDTVALADGAVGGLHLEALGTRRRGWRALRQLRARARSHDVVVGHGSATLLAGWATAGTGVPFVYRQISDPDFWAGTPWRRTRVRGYYRLPRSVVALSARTAEVLTARFGVDRARIVVIPNGARADAFVPAEPAERSEGRRQLGLGPDRVIVYLGALVPEKGVDLLVDAVAGLPGTCLVVAGDGPDRSRLEERARACRDRVLFVGPVSRPRDVLRAAHLVVLPSRGGDSMPAVLIEAGLMALPVVATRVGDVDEVVDHGATGFVVEPNDAGGLTAAIERALAPHEADVLGTNARARCLERFELGVVAGKWATHLSEVAGKG